MQPGEKLHTKYVVLLMCEHEPYATYAAAAGACLSSHKKVTQHGRHVKSLRGRQRGVARLYRLSLLMQLNEADVTAGGG